MLALSLKKLSVALARSPKATEVNIYLDHVGPQRLDEVEYVRDTYLPQAYIHQARPHIAAPSGCWNILNSIKAGYNSGAKRVYLVEEDIMVRPNFFEYHEHTLDDVDVSCGRKDKMFWKEFPGLYTNSGSAFRREMIAKLIPHINDIYFSELREYMDRELPPSWDSQSNLDDGLIRRVIRANNFSVAYPEVGVCAHQGFHYYNEIDRYMNREGSLQERIDRLEKMLTTVKPTERYARDLEVL